MKLYIKKELVIGTGKYRSKAHDLRMLGVNTYADGDYVVFVDGDTIKSIYSFEDMKTLVLSGEGYTEGVKWFYKMSKTDGETQLVPETLPNATYQRVVGEGDDPMHPITETVRRTRSERYSQSQTPVYSPDDTQVIMENNPRDAEIALSLVFFNDYITILSTEEYQVQMAERFPPLDIHQ